MWVNKSQKSLVFIFCVWTNTSLKKLDINNLYLFGFEHDQSKNRQIHTLLALRFGVRFQQFEARMIDS